MHQGNILDTIDIPLIALIMKQADDLKALGLLDDGKL